MRNRAIRCRRRQVESEGRRFLPVNTIEMAEIKLHFYSWRDLEQAYNYRLLREHFCIIEVRHLIVT
jgi:hypothetical protein